MDGIGNFHATPIFPISIFQYAKDINGEKGTPNYDLFQLAIKSTTKRIYPNYVNADWITNKHDPRPISLISVPALDKDVICSIINRDNDTLYTNTKIEEIWDALSTFKNNEVLFKDGYYYLDLRKNNVFVSDTGTKYKDYVVEDLEQEIAKVNYMAKSEDGEKYSITTDTFTHEYNGGDKYYSEHYGYVYDNDTEMATMGSCDGNSIITYKIKDLIY